MESAIKIILYKGEETQLTDNFGTIRGNLDVKYGFVTTVL
jgi:hypothetical protein